MDSHILAEEAKRIIENDAARMALNMIRAETLEKLLNTDPTDTDALRTHQATVRAIDEFFATLKGFVLNAQAKKPAGIA